MSTTTYQAFLARRAQAGDGTGFAPTWMPEFLFPFQRDLVDWSLRAGRGAVFADCGLGKTAMQLVWAANVAAHTGRPVLVLTPLAVSFQTVAEAAKFDIDAAVSRDGSVRAQITVTNYERLERFEASLFGGVVCDESSVLKAFDGKRRALVTEFLRQVPYRLLATATAAPNDYLELGTSSEALGHLGHMDMLGRFFTNKQRSAATGRGYLGAANEWRFKGHAEEPFWRWVASWARAVRKPSDLGFDDDGFHLPPLITRTHLVDAAARRDDHALFDLPAHGLREQREQARITVAERCEKAAELLADADRAVAWCHLNEESALLARLIDGAVELTGSDTPERKEAVLTAFTRGEHRVLVTKPSLGAWGLNWQHCHRMTYFPSYSYEQWYQAVRRCWRFGQPSPVTVDVVTTAGGAGILATLEHKAAQAERMFDALVAHMRDGIHVRPATGYPTPTEVPSWLAS